MLGFTTGSDCCRCLSTALLSNQTICSSSTTLMGITFLERCAAAWKSSADVAYDLVAGRPGHGRAVCIAASAVARCACTLTAYSLNMVLAYCESVTGGVANTGVSHTHDNHAKSGILSAAPSKVAGSKAARLRRSSSGLKLAAMAEEEEGGQPVAPQQLIRALSPQSAEGRNGVSGRTDSLS